MAARSSFALVLSLVMVAPGCSGDEFAAGESPDASSDGSAGSSGAGGAKTEAGADAQDKDAGQGGQDSSPGEDVVSAGCGDLKCANGESCQSCPQDCACAEGVCFGGVCCRPACENKQCGDDTCGGSCGTCDNGHACTAGQCTPQSGCGNGVCEPSVGENCVNCSVDCQCQPGLTCQTDGTCCMPTCKTMGSQCGFDTCGGVSCGGPCVSGQMCVQGLCVPATTCGNGTCEATLGENCDSCNWDCHCPAGKSCTAGGLCM